MCVRKKCFDTLEVKEEDQRERIVLAVCENVFAAARTELAEEQTDVVHVRLGGELGRQRLQRQRHAPVRRQARALSRGLRLEPCLVLLCTNNSQ